MKQLIIFLVVFVAVFAVSMEMYSIDPPEPNYYCAYFEANGRCYASVGTACYGIDADCNWLN